MLKTKTKQTKRKTKKALPVGRLPKAVRCARASQKGGSFGQKKAVEPVLEGDLATSSVSKNNRTCFVSRNTLPKEKLIRFVLGPERVLAFDLEKKLPGRGYWLCCDGFIVHQAVSKNLFQKAMHGIVKIPDDFENQIAEGMRRRCLQRISLCKKAGVLLSGFEKVKDALIKEKVQILIQAADAGADGREKLEAVCSKLEEKVFLVQDFSAEELGVAIGWEKGVYICIEKSPLAATLKTEVERMRSFLNKEEKKEDN